MTIFEFNDNIKNDGLELNKDYIISKQIKNKSDILTYEDNSKSFFSSFKEDEKEATMYIPITLKAFRTFGFDENYYQDFLTKIELSNTKEQLMNTFVFGRKHDEGNLTIYTSESVHLKNIEDFDLFVETFNEYEKEHAKSFVAHKLLHNVILRSVKSFIPNVKEQLLFGFLNCEDGFYISHVFKVEEDKFDYHKSIENDFYLSLVKDYGDKYSYKNNRNYNELFETYEYYKKLKSNILTNKDYKNFSTKKQEIIDSLYQKFEELKINAKKLEEFNKK